MNQTSTFHTKELTELSAIDPAVVAERGYVTVERPLRDSADAQSIPGAPYAPGGPRAILAKMGFPGWAIREDYFFPGMWIPGWSASGEKLPGQWKPKSPVRNRDGKTMKYASAKGSAARLDVHPRWTILSPELVPPIRDIERRLWITEGVKKADSLTSRGEVTVALAGVYNWRSTHGTLGDWEDIPLRGREVIVCFDADALTNHNVLRAMHRLGKWLRAKGAKPSYVIPPAGKGVDDYFAGGGSMKELERAITTRAPGGEVKEDTFTDSYLAEMAVADVLDGRYVMTAALGWMRWTGIVWTPVEDGVVLEDLRLWARDEYRAALEEQAENVRNGKDADPTQIDGWHKVQSASRLQAVLKLARNNEVVLRTADIFDRHPDLLNCPNGVVDLHTGEVAPHEADLYLTKVTAVDYLPEAEDKAFTQALNALPFAVRGWFQLQAGHALTGHNSAAMILATGGGNNGKTALIGTLFRTFGTHAAKVPNTLLLKKSGAGGPTPEKMTLRGVRFAYMEETPEEGYLDANTAKEILDAEEIDGRDLYAKSTSWKPTHSIFLNTNHPPIVTGTDDGTWRRLVRLEFPYRFRAPHEALERPGDLRGDGRLKRDLDTVEARTAALAWAVEGAKAWYANEQVMEQEPEEVRVATRKWREDSDDILRFFSGAVEFDPDRWVSAAELYAAYGSWASANGHRRMSSKEFAKRLAGHSALPAYVERKKVKTGSRPGESRPPLPFAGMSHSPLPAATECYLGLAFSA